jgi:uncharacterized protein YbaA (DUF1428 family)
MSYIDGFVIPVPTSNREAYVALAKTMAAIFVEYGAIRVVEGWGDDIKPGKINDFRTAVIAGDAETVAFSWTEWPSKSVRDAAHEKIMADPRVPAGGDMPFDGKRMIFGGFTPVLDTAN